MKTRILQSIILMLLIALTFTGCVSEDNTTTTSVTEVTGVIQTESPVEVTATPTTYTSENINEVTTESVYVPSDTSASESVESPSESITEPTKRPTANQEQPSAHIHKYSPATCTAPKTCSCGATEGKATGHSWTSATCTSPKTCTVCNTTSGKTAGHTFYNGNCSSCGKTDPDYVRVTMVWIPTNGGSKYHSRSGCSNMDNPDYVTKSQAESLGFTPCKKCY